MTVTVRLSDAPVLVMDHEFSLTILADLAPPADCFDLSVEVRGGAARATRFNIPAAGRGWCDMNGFSRHDFRLLVVVAEASLSVIRPCSEQRNLFRELFLACG